MGWFWSFIKTSVGKKEVMALTGFCFLLFLTAHLLGNLTMYGGAGAFDAYAKGLHTLEPLVEAAEIGLLTFAVLHIGSGLILFIGNRAARPVRYAVDKPEGGRTISSVVMPYSGLVILVFVVEHLRNFHFVDMQGRTISQVVSGVFMQPGYVAFYAVCVIILGFHVRHGFWSAFQTLGANHPKYMPLIRTLSVVAAVVFALGFAALPAYVYARGGLS